MWVFCTFHFLQLCWHLLMLKQTTVGVWAGCTFHFFQLCWHLLMLKQTTVGVWAGCTFHFLQLCRHLLVLKQNDCRSVGFLHIPLLLALLAFLLFKQNGRSHDESMAWVSQNMPEESGIEIAALARCCWEFLVELERQRAQIRKWTTSFIRRTLYQDGLVQLGPFNFQYSGMPVGGATLRPRQCHTSS